MNTHRKNPSLQDSPLVPRPVLVTLASCAVAFGAGAIFAGIPHFFPTSSPETPGTAIQAESVNPGPNRVVSGIAVQASFSEESVAEAFRTETGAKRWLTLLSAAEKATAEEMPALLRIAGNDGAAVRMLASRWAELDPKHMWVSICADYLTPSGTPGMLPSRWVLSDMLFERWMKHDRTAALQALDDSPLFPELDHFRVHIAKRVMKADVEEGLRLMEKWNILHFGPDMKVVGEWATANPQRAVEMAMKLRGTFTAHDILEHVSKSMAKADPQVALRFAATLEPNLRERFSGEAIRAWAEKDVNAAAAFAAAQTDPYLRASLSSAVAFAWGKSDPIAALAWSEKILPPNARAGVIPHLIMEVAKKDLTAASQLAADMEPGAAQNNACASIFETWFEKGPTEREAALEWLASLPDDSARRAGLQRVARDWAQSDPDGMRDFISGPLGHIAEHYIIREVAEKQTAKNPQAAMEWATSLPGYRGANACLSVMDQWMRIRPDDAAAYARHLPAGQHRELAIGTVSHRFLDLSVEQAASWYHTLPAADQKIAREAFDRQKLSEAKKRRLEQALNQR